MNFQPFGISFWYFQRTSPSFTPSLLQSRPGLEGHCPRGCLHWWPAEVWENISRLSSRNPCENSWPTVKEPGSYSGSVVITSFLQRNPMVCNRKYRQRWFQRVSNCKAKSQFLIWNHLKPKFPFSLAQFGFSNPFSSIPSFDAALQKPRHVEGWYRQHEFVRGLSRQFSYSLVEPRPGKCWKNFGEMTL